MCTAAFHHCFYVRWGLLLCFVHELEHLQLHCGYVAFLGLHTLTAGSLMQAFGV